MDNRFTNRIVQSLLPLLGVGIAGKNVRRGRLTTCFIIKSELADAPS